MSTINNSRTPAINLRIPETQRQLIDRAAKLTGKNRTDFMLEAACEKAQQVLLDQTVFVLDEAGFQRFVDLLEKPANNVGVERLLARRAPWKTQENGSD